MTTPNDVFNGNARAEDVTGDQQALGKAIVTHALEAGFARTPERLESFRRLFTCLDDVAAVSIWNGMCGHPAGPGEVAGVVAWLHPACVHRIQAAFGVAVGAAGVGQTPTITAEMKAYFDANGGCPPIAIRQ